MVKNEGVISLFSGVTGRMMWLTPRCAIAMTSYGIFNNALLDQDFKH
jgi:hypothetical protein